MNAAALMNRSDPSLAGAAARALCLACALLVPACGGRRPPLPDVAGSLADVVVRASFADEQAREPAPVQPLWLDSISFARLGAAAGGGAFGAEELRRQVGRPFQLVDPADVLECPDREPCRTVDDAVYLEVWEAERTGAELELVVNRVFNVQGLYRMTTAVTHRLVLRAEGGGWRLARRERLPT
jgi:hypothetical protein